MMEGVATCSSNQMGTYLYPSQEETYALIRSGNRMPPEDFETAREDEVALNVKNRKPFSQQSTGLDILDPGGPAGRPPKRHSVPARSGARA